MHYCSNMCTPAFNGVCVTQLQYLYFCVVFCRSLFALLSFFIWSLCCLSFFDLRLLITHLVSSNFSYYAVMQVWYICFFFLYFLQLPKTLKLKLYFELVQIYCRHICITMLNCFLLWTYYNL